MVTTVAATAAPQIEGRWRFERQTTPDGEIRSYMPASFVDFENGRAVLVYVHQPDGKSAMRIKGSYTRMIDTLPVGADQPPRAVLLVLWESVEFLNEGGVGNFRVQASGPAPFTYDFIETDFGVAALTGPPLGRSTCIRST